MKNKVFILLGSLCVGLAVVGIILPILPTTPFLLLAAFFYARSSQRFYHWLITNRWFGAYIRNYREGLGIPLKQKISVISLLWFTIGYSVWQVVSIMWVQVILVGIAISVTIHLIRVKTYKEEINLPKILNTTPHEEKNIQT